MSDSEVARRLGVGQGRYSSWVNDTHEPDLETLTRVVGVLAMTADQALGIVPQRQLDPDGSLRSRAEVALRSMSGTALAGATGMLEALARVTGDDAPPGQGPEKSE